MGSRLSDSSPSRIHAFIPWLLAAVSLALPFLFRGTLADPFQLPKDILFRWGALLILGFWLAGTLAHGRVSLRRTGVAAPVFLLIFIGLLSVFQAPNPAEASSAVRDMSLCAVVLFLSLAPLENRRGMVASCLALSAALTAAVGTLQLLFGPRVSFLPSTQGGSLVGDVTTGAIYVAMVLPLILERTVAPTRLARVWAVGFGIALAYLVLARTRAAWLGATVGLLFFAVSTLRRPRSPQPEGTAAWAGIGPVLAGTLLAVALALGGSYGRGIKLLSSPPSLKTAELQGLPLQLYTWQTTSQLILSHPLGVGAASWRRAIPQEMGNLAPDYPFNASRVPQSAGDEYLETAAELGVAGLFILLWILARILSATRRTTGGAWSLQMGAAASLASAAACALLSTPLREQPGLWAITVLSALILASRPAEAAEVPPDLQWEMAPGRRRVMGGLAGILFALLAGVCAWDSYRDATASASLQAGQSAYLRGDYAAALPLLRQAFMENPSSSLARYLAGACALASGRLDLAEEELTEARRLNPQDATTLLALASTLQAKGNMLGAVGVAEKARKIWPRDETVNMALGDFRRAAGDSEGSLEAYRAALQSNQYSVNTYLKMGSLMESRSQMSGAVGAYSKAVALDPYRPEALARLGSAYMRQGNYEAAVSVFSNLLSLAPDDVPTLVNLARTLSGLQRPCEAARLLKKARGLDSNPSRQVQLDLALNDLSEKCARSGPPAR